MINVVIKNNIKNFEADIRDLVMAFYPYQEYNFIYEDTIKNIDNIRKNGDIYIDNYYDGKTYKSRFDTKNHLKRSLYKYLKNKTSKNLPWGTLTGIRPVNILTEGVGDKKDIEKFIDKKTKKYNTVKVKKYLKEEYFVSLDKIKELIDIANNEKEILLRKELKNYKKRCSVYIGIPFCKTTCLYCSFTSYSIERYKDEVSKYLLALDNELTHAIRKNNDIKNPLTIYVGGGTPTSLDEEHFEQFLNIVNKHFDIRNNKSIIEYTIEAGRPDTITKKKLELMKEYNVSRISINPQTFNQKTLDLIGRKHKVEDVIEKFNLARELGFNNINMDIILGLPKENLDDVVNTLIVLGNLNPDNITIHSLALKRAARLNYEKDNWIENLETENINNMFLCAKYLMKILKQKPYYLYRQKNIKQNLENIGYSVKGKECIYNIIMMGEKHTVYGFGCGGVGKKVEYKGKEKIVERMKGTKSLVDYIDKNMD